jgi:hypothetical protein
MVSQKLYFLFNHRHMHRFFTLLLFSLFSFSGILAQETGKYCNGRYNYCLEYPEALFPKKDISENNDGLVLTSADGDIQVRVFGYFNVMDWPIQDEYEDFLEVVKSSLKVPIDDVSTVFSGDEFESVITAGDKIHYERTILKDNNFISLTIATNRRGMDDITHSLDSLKQQVSLLVE